jgi:cytochrome c
MKKVIFIIVGGLLLSGCFVVRRDIVPSNPMFDQGRGWFFDSNFTSNGEQIYFTAINERGQRIRYSGGQNFGGMMMGMGNNLACASCHGSDGRGGIHTMHMEVMDAPDIRYPALNGDAGTEEHRDEDHTDEHNEYDLAAFRLAVVEGKHPNGIDLSKDMPRWQMGDEDLADLFEYLKSLP